MSLTEIDREHDRLGQLVKLFGANSELELAERLTPIYELAERLTPIYKALRNPDELQGAFKKLWDEQDRIIEEGKGERRKKFVETVGGIKDHLAAATDAVAAYETGAGEAQTSAISPEMFRDKGGVPNR